MTVEHKEALVWSSLTDKHIPSFILIICTRTIHEASLVGSTYEALYSGSSGSLGVVC
jgi:hypothetical protein